MGWTTLSARLPSLPLVLAGPILRKTTKNSVTVWIALRQACSNIKLEIYDDAGAPSPVGGSVHDTVQIGTNLHIALMTVDGLNLQSDTIYWYDIIFGSSGDRLDTPGILNPAGSPTGGHELVSYSQYTLPSFLLPASSVENLKIIHGSCRKPHGGQMSGDDPQTPGYFEDIKYKDIDALSIADDILSAYASDTLNRPQQLFLTGDQVYCDDVADLLLFLIEDAGPVIVGITESLPGLSDSSTLPPLTRYRLFKDMANMTSNEFAKCGLAFLAEFYCMYLFTWAETLWTDLPSYDQAHDYYLKNVFTDPDNKNHFELDESKAKDYYSNECDVLNKFMQSLPKVRKALANIPTYMMVDDHDITDDWFIDERWCVEVLGNSLGKRIIQNGMCAFTIFQMCGNTPELYGNSSSTESQIVSKLNQLYNERGGTASTWNDIGSLIVPKTDFSGANSEEMMRLISGPDYYFYLDCDFYQVIVLNSRTRRGYNPDGYVRLLSSGTIDYQLNQGSTDTKYKFTIIVAPAPVIGHTIIEFIQAQTGRGTHAKVAEKDYEPWSADPPTLSSLLKKTAKYRRVIFLSGDVHYAFTAQVDYNYNLNISPNQEASFAQLTSSSLKNSDVKTSSYAYLRKPFLGVQALSGGKGFDFKADLVPLTVDGWDSAGKVGEKHIIMNDGTTLDEDFIVQTNRDYNVTYNEGIMAMSLLYSLYYNIASPPDRQYVINFKTDTRKKSDRGSVSYDDPGYNNYCSAAKIHRKAAPFDGMSVAVGMNNLGELTFLEDSSGIKVTQRLWYKPENISDEGAWTIHNVTLK